MPNLTPSSSGRDDPPATRVIVVRDAPRSVRPGDEPSRFGARIGFWTSIGAGIVAAIWLTGHLGESLGFARALGMPMVATSDDAGLVAGVRILLTMPLRIFEMTMVDPLRLAAAFVLVSLPAAGLAAARPRVPGGPRPSKLAHTFAVLGVIGASLVFIIIIAWIAWPDRRAALASAPFDRDAFAAWLASATATAGFDALAFLAGVLWLILLFRLPLPRVVTGAASVPGCVAAFAAWTGLATSNGLVDGCTLRRPVVVWSMGRDLPFTHERTASGVRDPSEVLLLGLFAEYPLVLLSGPHPALKTSPATDFKVVDQSSLAEWMRPEAE